ncbi:sensor histidine kinase [Paenibacillus eucommiae]|uniref:histidine kinase n=1 Tax=Paenibacillus eucommiae TaxID=1355755 RepID=A0ABS4IXU7_9BACL|nr:HAMP domain-containing sensor histidine kinase [Paenibacillus eucommiae]MBP1992370.1 signal transduction histidine kinase [Paenibacillus eucommiae]
MKGNVTAGMLIRFLGYVVLSIVLSFITVFICYNLLKGLTRNYYFLSRVANEILGILGETVIVISMGAVFFVLYLIILQWRWFRYVGEMSEAVMHIAEGHFDHKIAVKQSNELSNLAANINRLVEQHQRSLDEERKTEQTKNELITNVSHDLRTPLTSIIGYLGLIEQDRYRDEVELRHYVQIAYEKSQRLNLLINDLFEYTRMRHDAPPLQSVAFNLIEMLNQLLVQYRMQMEQAGLVGRLQTAETKVMVGGDPNKLVRVFENLLINAIIYGCDGHGADIRIRCENGEANVEVVNYGDPIPPSDLPHIFDRFYRVDKSRTEHAGGSGLGLAIAKGIVENHGGRISVTSNSYETSFQVVLPLASKQEKQR